MSQRPCKFNLLKFSHKFKDFLAKGNKVALINAKFLYIALTNGFIYALLHMNTFALHLFRGLTWNLAMFFIFFYLCSLFGKAFYQIALNLAFVASFVISLINLFLFINFNAFLDPIALQIFFATNSREASEFIALYTNGKTILAFALFIIISFVAYFASFSLRFSKRLCALLSLLCFVPLASNFIKTNYNHTANKTQLLHFTQTFTKGYKERMHFIKEFRNLNKKLNLAIAEKLADKRERERERREFRTS